MSTAGTLATGFSLRLPESWYEFDIWRATRTGDLGRLVDRRIAELPELRAHRGALVRLLREAAETAERRGAVYCAASGDTTDDGALAATVMVFQLPALPGGTVEAIAAQVTATAPRPGSPAFRTVGIVTVPAGRAVRLAGVSEVDLGQGRRAPMVVMQTLVPVPDGASVLNVVLTSPQIDLAEPMLDLFAAVSDTFAWPLSLEVPTRGSSR